MINQLTIMGRLVRDAETRKVNKGFITTFTLAVNKDKDNAMFIPCEYFSESDKLAVCLTKGLKVVVSGTINQDSWKDKEGNNHNRVYVYARLLEFAESKKETPTDLPY